MKKDFNMDIDYVSSFKVNDNEISSNEVGKYITKKLGKQISKLIKLMNKYNVPTIEINLEEKSDKK